MDTALSQALRHLTLNLTELLTCSVSRGEVTSLGLSFPCGLRSGRLSLCLWSLPLARGDWALPQIHTVATLLEYDILHRIV